ncbi:hypothetical protein B2J93_908 [Marssonina coronariae]|uniref:Uncharacterized protein n=1 Tax=Diplocarpon coronariae TaxID=2795749 RepID=A0A218ZDV5_9HELO|nr:hypothetical protein B2J93_908 [Marssonina coronariae]
MTQLMPPPRQPPAFAQPTDTGAQPPPPNDQRISRLQQAQTRYPQDPARISRLQRDLQMELVSWETPWKNLAKWKKGELSSRTVWGSNPAFYSRAACYPCHQSSVGEQTKTQNTLKSSAQVTAPRSEKKIPRQRFGPPRATGLTGRTDEDFTDHQRPNQDLMRQSLLNRYPRPLHRSIGRLSIHPPASRAISTRNQPRPPSTKGPEKSTHTTTPRVETTPCEPLPRHATFCPLLSPLWIRVQIQSPPLTGSKLPAALFHRTGGGISSERRAAHQCDKETRYSARGDGGYQGQPNPALRSLHADSYTLIRLVANLQMEIS